MTRRFTSYTATRANVPLLIALIGPSGSGKTYSAHRLAAGIARVQPGPVTGISTEGNRMLELAPTEQEQRASKLPPGKFSFRHMPFSAPFGSLDYLAAMQQAAAEGAQTVIVDSMSHEHEGPGGLLERVDQIVEEKIQRKVKYNDLPSADGHEADKVREKLRFGAYVIPKADRTKLINGIVQLPCNVILCFRAKEKIDPSKKAPGGGLLHLGWQPIAGDEFWYEMTTRCLLTPACDGIPKWKDLAEGEKIAARCPQQFRGLLRDGVQLTEDVGQAMAEWATGPAAVNVEDAVTKLAGAGNLGALTSLAKELGKLPWSEDQRAMIRMAIDARQKELKG